MSEERSSAFLVTITICVVITMLSLEVDAQSTVDDSASCVSSTFCDQCDAVDLIRDVKNLLGPNQQQNDESCVSRKDFEDLKAACASNQQQNNESSRESSTLDEAVNLIRDVKNLLRPNQQQNNASSRESSTLDEVVNLIRDVKNLLGPNQQQNNASCISFQDLKAACASNQQQCPSPPTAPSSSNQALISSFICEYMSHVIRFCADRSQGLVYTPSVITS